MTALGGISSSSTIQSTDVGDFSTSVYTRMKSVLVAGTNVTLTPNDGAGTITVNSAGGGGGSFIDSVSDTNTVDVTVAAGQLSAVIPTTATPTIRKITLSAAAMTDQVIVDTTHGDLGTIYGVGIAGHRWDARHGSSSTPVTTDGPSYKLSRTQEFTTVTNPAEYHRYTTLEVVNKGLAADESQVVAIVAGATTLSTVADSGGPHDACALVSIGVSGTNATGAGIGAFIEGGRVGSTGEASGLQVACRTGGVDGTYAPTASLDTVECIRATCKDGRGGSAYNIAAGNGYFQVGYAVKNLTDGSGNAVVKDSSYRDDGAALVSHDIRGTHATAAIKVEAAAGKTILGAASTVQATRVFVKPASDADFGLYVAPFSATQSAALIYCVDNSGVEVFSVNNIGNLRLIDRNLVLSSVTGTKFGTATTQKLSFYNATPIAQPSGIGAAATDLATVITLANNMRTAAINLGLLAA